MTPQHHTIDYIELTAPDLDAARGFYGTAFGWTFNDYGPDYAGIRRPSETGGESDGEIGGLRRTDDVKIGGPLVVLFSENLEASVAAVRAAGGRIVREPYAFPGGRRFHFSDPAGHELAVYSIGPDGSQRADARAKRSRHPASGMARTERAADDRGSANCSTRNPR